MSLYSFLQSFECPFSTQSVFSAPFKAGTLSRREPVGRKDGEQRIGDSVAPVLRVSHHHRSTEREQKGTP